MCGNEERVGGRRENELLGRRMSHGHFHRISTRTTIPPPNTCEALPSGSPSMSLQAMRMSKQTAKGERRLDLVKRETSFETPCRSLRRMLYSRPVREGKG